MVRKVAVSLLCCLVVALVVTPTFAAHEFKTNQTFGTVGGAAVVTNSGFAPLWSNGLPTGDGTDINITNIFLQVTTITNFFSVNNGSLNFVRVISGNGASSSNVTLISTTDIFSRFGFQLGAGATWIIANTATLGNNENNSFNLTGGGG